MTEKDQGRAPTDNLQENINRYLPFLMEIRKRILFLLSIFLTFSVLGFLYYEKIISIVLGVLNLQKVNIVFTSPFQFLSLAISSGFIVGTVAILPLVIIQALSFLKPALRTKEYRLLVLFLPVSLLLFGGGFSFGASMMKYVLELFLKKSVELNIGNILDISALLTGILTTSALMGLAFQFPIVLTVLLRLNVVKHQLVARQRPFVYCAVLVFSALLPPTDLLSLFLLALPLVFLFEITLLLNKIFNKPKELRKEVENV